MKTTHHVNVESAERNQQILIHPAEFDWNKQLREISCGYLFADGLSAWTGGHCTHDKLFNLLKGVPEFKDRPECEILSRCGLMGEGWVELWDTGVVRVMTGGSQGWHLTLHGQYMYVLARTRELLDVIGPDAARTTIIIFGLIEEGTDLELLYYIGTVRNGYAWLLLGCANYDNKRIKTGGYGTCSNHIEPGEQEAHLALKKAGYRWA